MDIEARGHAVYDGIKLLVALSAEQSRLRAESYMGHPEDYFVTPNDDTYPGALALDAGHSPSSSMALQFSSSRSRTSSTTRGHQFDEAVFQSIPKSTHGLARTVRRTLSGGLSNILRPFQPPVTKVHCEENYTAGTLAPSNGFHKIKRKVSSNFSKALSGDGKKTRKWAKEKQRRNTKVTTATGSKSISLRNRKARESVCSRNSTISVLEYLAARRQKEEESLQAENLVPLSEYGRNCHLYGCDSLHIWNPDKNSSRPVIHCNCDTDDRSTSHTHINESLLFYKPGGSASTITQSMSACTSSLLVKPSNESLRNSPRPSNSFTFSRYCSSVNI